MKRRTLMDQESSHNVIEADVESMLQDVSKQDRSRAEPVILKKKVIKTLDSLTKIEYKLEVDPKTGQQFTVEYWDSNKKQCTHCGKLTPQLYTCELCGKEVCGRDYGSVDVTDGYRTVTYQDWNDKWFLDPKTKSREEPVYKHLGVCSNCYHVKTGHGWEESPSE